MATKLLTDKEILSIFVSYLDHDVLVLDPLTRVSPFTLEWLNGLYYGHPIVFDAEIGTDVPSSLGECRIILRPLVITDALCLSIGNDFYISYDHDKKISTVRNQLGAAKFGGQCDYRILRKLRDVGIAVPYMGMDLFKHGIAITEEEASNLINTAPDIDFLEPAPQEEGEYDEDDDY